MLTRLRTIKALLLLFLAFEVSRFVWLSEKLWPIWKRYADDFSAMAHQPPKVAIVSLGVSALAVVAQVAALAYLYRFAKHRLSRFRTRH